MIMNVQHHLPELEHLCLCPLASGPLTLTHFKQQMDFLSAQTIATGFPLHKRKQGIVNDSAPVVLPEFTKLCLDLITTVTMETKSFYF